MSARTSYEARAESGFLEVQSQLAALAVRAKQATASGGVDGDRCLLAAQSKHDEALHRLELLKLSGEDSWNAVKTTFETAWIELGRALKPRGDRRG
jgi:hypothetical protein